MSVKATIKPRSNNLNPQIVDAESSDSTNELARQLGVEAVTTVGGVTEIHQAVPVEEAESSDAPQAVAVRHNAPPPAVNRYTADSGGGLEGEFEQSDLKIPQLKIVNGSGALSQKFNQGSLILGEQLLWMPPNLQQPNAKNPTLVFIPVKVKKQFRENLTQEQVTEGLMPRVVNSRAEADDLAGDPNSTQWVNGQRPRWSPSATCLLLVAEPELNESVEQDSQFMRRYDDRNWALAVYYASGMGYAESAKVILSNAYTVLRERSGRIVLHKRLWTWQVGKKKPGQFAVFVPILRLTREDTGPETLEAIEDIIGAPTPTTTLTE